MLAIDVEMGFSKSFHTMLHVYSFKEKPCEINLNWHHFNTSPFDLLPYNEIMYVGKNDKYWNTSE